jgi:hypothetical protein
MMVAAEVALLVPKHEVVHNCLAIISGGMQQPSQAPVAGPRSSSGSSSSSNSSEDADVKQLAHHALRLLLVLMAPAILAACKQEETDGLQQEEEQERDKTVHPSQQQQQQQQQQEVAERWAPVRQMLGINIARAIQAGKCTHSFMYDRYISPDWHSCMLL